MGYNEICEELLDEKDPWTSMWEENHLAPYMYRLGTDGNKSSFAILNFFIGNVA